MEQHDVIAHYQAVADRCQALFARASQGAWTDLIVAQNEYLGAVEQLAAVESGVMLDPTARARKHELLVEIRDTEDAIRALLEARMNQLSRFMAQSRSRRRVRLAYGAEASS